MNTDTGNTVRVSREGTGFSEAGFHTDVPVEPEVRASIGSDAAILQFCDL
jgi:hypothetical protein